MLLITDHYGIELVSPIHTADSLPTGTLHTILTRIFTHLPHIIPSTSCSSHIHISRADKPLNHLDLADLGKAALYFETALDALLPPSRRTTPTSSTYWFQSLRSSTNPSLAGLALLPCFDKINAAAAEGSMRSVVEVLNLHSKSTPYAVAKGKTADFIRGKTYKWDFSGLLSNEVVGERDGVVDCGIEGTVEFRQPPGSGNAEEAMGWAVLGVAFVAGAVAVGGGLGIVGGELREEGGSVRELWRLLQRGREVVGWRDLEAIKGLFWRAGEQV